MTDEFDEQLSNVARMVLGPNSPKTSEEALSSADFRELASTYLRMLREFSEKSTDATLAMNGALRRLKLLIDTGFDDVPLEMEKLTLKRGVTNYQYGKYGVISPEFVFDDESGVELANSWRIFLIEMIKKVIDRIRVVEKNNNDPHLGLLVEQRQLIQNHIDAVKLAIEYYYREQPDKCDGKYQYKREEVERRVYFESQRNSGALDLVIQLQKLMEFLDRCRKG